MPKDLKEEMKKIRKKVWDKNKKKYKDFGTFGEDEFLKQDRLPGMKYGGTVMPKDKPKEKQKPKDFYEGEGYKGSPDMYPDYEEDKKDIKKGKKPQHMGMKKGSLAGKQKKLDVNKDGKISGEDFEILRGKTNKMKGGGCAIKGTKFKGVF